MFKYLKNLSICLSLKPVLMEKAMAVAKSEGKVRGGAGEAGQGRRRWIGKCRASSDPKVHRLLAVPLLNRIILLSLWVTTTHTNYSA